MNRNIVTVVVVILVFAMVSTIAWNEYVHAMPEAALRASGPTAGWWGAGEHAGMGVRENTSNTPNPMLTKSPSPMFTSTLPIRHPIHTSIPSSTPPREASPPGGSTHTLLNHNIPTTTLPATSTPTQTPSPTITIPLMQVVSQFGVNLRDAPGGEVIQGLVNGTLVQPYLGSEEEAGGLHWLHVVTLDGMEGWLAVNNLIPVSGTPSATP